MSPSAVSPALAIALAVAGAAILAGLDWRRRESRNRPLRIIASVTAAAALSLLGIYRSGARPEPQRAGREAILWTHNAETAPPEALAGESHFALAGVTEKPAEAITLPDVSYLRREFREVGTLRIVGDGLEAFELEVLAGVNLVFAESQRPPSKPAITFVTFPRQLTVGERLHLQAQVNGLRAGETLALTLTNPDGTKSEATVTAKDAEQVNIALIAAAPQSAGRFLWRLSARSAGSGETLLDETIGVPVVRPLLPRVLVIESSPRLETAHLRRWFADIGGRLISRTTVGRGRHRFAGSDEAAFEFEALNRELLSGFDVVLVDADALNALTPEERDALNAAVAEEGLGALILNPAGDAAERRDDSLLPWTLESAEDSEAAEGSGLRSARLAWPGLAAPLEYPVAVASVRMRAGTHHDVLVTDAQERPIVTSIQRGRGRLALSIARDTWKWRLEDQSATFASYWSYVLTRLAKPQERQAERWTIENARSAPLAVNRPIHLRLSGPMEPPSIPHVTSEAEQEQVTLPLAQDAIEPHDWRSTFWPRRAGWHRVQIAPDGAHLDFFVHEANAWSSLAPARRMASTRLAAANRKRGPAVADGEWTNEPRPTSAAKAALCYALFLLSISYLWVERRGWQRDRLASEPAAGFSA